jgi:hypothetical protein
MIYSFVMNFMSLPISMRPSRIPGFSRLLAVLLFAVVVALPVPAQDKPKDQEAAYDPRSSSGAGQKFLEKFAGDWTVEKRFHPRTGDPVVTKGECHQAMIQDGKFLKSDFVFRSETTNVTGTGLVGFEPATGLFTSVWADSHSTRMSIRQSKEPFNGSEIMLSSLPTGSNGVREARLSRNVTQLTDEGKKIVHKQFAIEADNSERLMFELILTRKSP